MEDEKSLPNTATIETSPNTHDETLPSNPQSYTPKEEPLHELNEANQESLPTPDTFQNTGDSNNNEALAVLDTVRIQSEQQERTMAEVTKEVIDKEGDSKEDEAKAIKKIRRRRSHDTRTVNTRKRQHSQTGQWVQPGEKAENRLTLSMKEWEKKANTQVHLFLSDKFQMRVTNNEQAHILIDQGKDDEDKNRGHQMFIETADGHVLLTKVISEKI